MRWRSRIKSGFIDKCSSYHLRRLLLQEPNLTLEKVVQKTQAMELAKKQSVSMQLEEMQIGMAKLKVAQDKYAFLSNKCCFHCGSSTHFVNKWTVAKGKLGKKLGKEGLFTAACKLKP